MKSTLFQKLTATMKQLIVFGSLFNLVACGAASTGTSTATDDSTTFPSALAVASPLSFTEDTSSSSSITSLEYDLVSDLIYESEMTRYASSGSGTMVPAYTWATGRIDQILNGTTPTHCAFDPALFLTQETDAECYGPTVDYESHPDATVSPADGELPSGDVGMWAETDAVTGQACAASELNARMAGLQDRSIASLMGLASLVCTANVNGIAMPDATTPSVDLTTLMSATDTTFNSATISYDSSTGAYSYHLDFQYAPSASYDIVVDMQHIPSTTTPGVYDGQISYLVNDTFLGGNCPTNDITYNGSLQYSRNSATDIQVQVRQGQFCEHDSDGRDSNNLVDPGNKYNASTNPTGWGNNFSIFTANYDPTTLDGNYSYAWQAGPNDDNARVFNLKANASSSTAVAYFGYGDDIETTNGSIEGFICNWAGPEADHTIVEKAQYQAVEVDATAGTIAATASQITYAPTNSCDYDGTGSFLYDTDADNDLTDETHAAVTNDLEVGSDLDSDGNATIEEVIDNAGFTVPTI